MQSLDQPVHIVEPLCGSAAFSRALAGNIKSPTSYAGSKDAFVHVLMELANVRPDQVNAITLNDKGMYGTIWRALLQDANIVADVLEQQLAPLESMSEVLWYRLKEYVNIDQHAANCLPLHEQAAIYLAYLAGAYGSMEKSGFRGRHKNRPADTGFIPHLDSVAKRVRDFDCSIESGNDIRWCISQLDASHLLQHFRPASPGERVVCLIDPPYGQSGKCYFNDFSRAQVLALAVEWATRVPNCTVLICESEPLADALNLLTLQRYGIAWQSVDVTDKRRGHCRQQTTQAEGLREFVTMAVPPLAIVF